MSTKKPSVVISILNFNGLEDTKACVRTVLKTKYNNFSVYIIDNGSRINEANLLKKEFSDRRVFIQRNSKNLGFTGANNKLAQKVKSKYIVFLNNDTVVEPDWLKYLVEEAEADTSNVACQSKVLLLDNPKKFDYAGACGGFIDQFGYPFTRGRVFYSSENDRGQYDRRVNLFWSSGVSMLVRRDAFIDIGMFDNSFFLYMEEIDICWRLQASGYKIRFVPESVIYHKVAASAKKNLFKKRFYEHRNNLIMITKNYSTSDLLTLLPIRLLMEFVTIFFYIKQLDTASLRGLLYAHAQYLFLFPKIISERKGEKRSIREYTSLVYLGSTVFQYFILGKKKILIRA